MPEAVRLVLDAAADRERQVAAPSVPRPAGFDDPDGCGDEGLQEDVVATTAFELPPELSDLVAPLPETFSADEHFFTEDFSL